MVTPFHGNSQPIARSAATSIPQGFVQVYGPNGEPLPFAMNLSTGESSPIQQQHLSPELQELNDRLNSVVSSVYLGLDAQDAMQAAANYGIDKMYPLGWLKSLFKRIEGAKTRHFHARPAMRSTIQGGFKTLADISESFQQAELTKQQGQVQVAAAKTTAAVTSIHNDVDYIHQKRILDDQHRRDFEKLSFEWHAKLHAIFAHSFGTSPRVVAQRYVEALTEQKEALAPLLELVSGKEKQVILDDFSNLASKYREEYALPQTNQIINKLMSDMMNDNEKSA